MVESSGGPTAGSPGEGERSEDTTVPPDGSSEAASLGSAIHAGLAGKRILLTGVTGFLGQALFERLLAGFPDTRLVLLIRGQYGTTARARAEELLQRPVFNSARERLGADGLRATFDERVEVLEGDVVGELPRFPADIDLVYHCAATVSFDSPIDEGFRANVVGATALYGAVADSGSRPHLVHVSTAYVAGSRKGVVPEAPLDHGIDWRAELEYALSARERVEEASRRPELLDSFVKNARAEHGRAGPQEVAEHAETRRRDWVTKRLIHYGRSRARTLGWPDIYTLTKALGERAVEETAGDLPLSIVRPSIIESAYVHPHPGWIEGFKMAEPIILAYGRAAFPEFPGIPEGILDVIPVDYVVNALLAVGARATEPGDRVYHHVCSGERNPLLFRKVYENVREYFGREPLPDRGRGFVKPPVWEFPGQRVVERRLRTGEKAIAMADRWVRRLPRSPRTRKLVEQLDRTKGRVDFLRRYADLYGAYVEAEVIYTDDRTLDYFRSLPEADREEFPFDAADIDWRYYLQDVHCPAITVAMRFPPPPRPAPEVRVREREEPVLAAFDMEGTILSSNVIESYLWLRMADLQRESWPGEVASVARKLPAYLSAERRDRGEFLRSFYRRYEGASVEELRRIVDEQVAEIVLQRISPPAIRRIREHRRAGHRTVLITGALEVFVQPLAPLFDEIVAARLDVVDGRYTGYLRQPPLVGEARAAWLRQYAVTHKANLRQSYAYADSHTDLPLLRAVGNPVAVNPDVALFRVAKKRRWPVEEWHAMKGTPRVMLPEPASS
ncbi:MAG TPA: HAD-IB family hydrolase [Actinomycetota bacterium]